MNFRNTLYSPSSAAEVTPSPFGDLSGDFSPVTVVVTLSRRTPAIVVKDEHARFDTGHFPARALAPVRPRGMGYCGCAGIGSIHRFYTRLPLQRSRAWPGRLDGGPRRGSCGAGVCARSARCAGFRYGSPDVPDARRCALLAEIRRLDGRVRFVISPSLRDDYGRSARVGRRVLPRVARVGGRPGSTLVPHDTDRGARRPLSRWETRPPLDTLAVRLVDRVGGSDLVPASRLLGRLYGRDSARRHIRTGISLPARFYADRAPTNQVGTVRVPALVAADNDAGHTLRYRVEPHARQPSSLVDPC